jgi:hypothetical protein
MGMRGEPMPRAEMRNQERARIGLLDSRASKARR